MNLLYFLCSCNVENIKSKEGEKETDTVSEAPSEQLVRRCSPNETESTFGFYDVDAKTWEFI